jgi:hypothetical protein
MTAWPDLLATALVGTDRRGPATDDAARQLLGEAAAWSVYRRAGVRAMRGLTAPAPAPVESRPVVPAAAASRLAVLMDAEPFAGTDAAGRTALRVEWLRAVIDLDLRVPPEYLPILMEHARIAAEVRPLVMAAGGARTAWLLAQNPQWSFLTATVDESGADDPVTWQEGTTGQRTGYLVALRRSAPEEARALLVADWPQLDVDERTHLLAALAVGLGPADEEFIEQALDDRRREVRFVAGELLSDLPGSAYQDRMARRTAEYLTIVDNRLVVNPPAECDPTMRRDGIDHRPPTGIGARAWWLRQVVAHTPLAAVTDLDPAAFLALPVDDDWAAVVQEGLAEAAKEQRDPRWSAALLDALTPRLAANKALAAVIADLLPALDDADILQRTVAVLTRPPGELTRLVPVLLDRCPAPWSDELAEAALRNVLVVGLTTPAPYDVYAATRTAGLRLPHSYAARATELAERLTTKDSFDRRAQIFDRLVQTLQFRHSMIQELA